MIPIQIQFVSEEAKNLYNGKLEYATDGSSGFDLRACGFDTSFDKFGAIHNIDKNWQDDTPPPIIGYTLFAGRRILIKTGIKVKISKTYQIDTQFLVNGIKASIDLAFLLDRPDALQAIDIWEEKYSSLMGDAPLINQQYEIQIRSRSGLALKNGICVLNGIGTIDSDYNKEIGVILYNAGHEPFEITKGMRIAQAVICPVMRGNFEYVDDIDDSGRGGYGSTGVK